MEHDATKVAIAEAYNAVFEAALGRRPTPEEMEAWLNNNGATTPVSALAKSLRTVDEYYNNIAIQSEQISRAANGKKSFFLHIPKSAGSSVREAIREALGRIPPLELSYFPLDYQVPIGPTCWPFLTGHVGIDAYPLTHIGVTVFREPRSRLLSLHRFMGSRHFEEFLKARGMDANISTVCRESSIETLIHNSSLTSIHVPRLTRETLTFSWMFAHDFSESVEFDRRPESERSNAIKQGLGRITHAAWSHDKVGLARMVQSATGEYADIRTMNVTKPSIDNNPGVINKQTRNILKDFLSEDIKTLEYAASIGLVSRMSSDLADESFKETAIKLGYEYR